MPVKTLDHVAINTADMDGSVAFFAEMMGLEPSEVPGRNPATNRWMRDGGDRAIVHLIRGDVPGLANGAFDHVAFECEGLDAMRDRLTDAGHAVRQLDAAVPGLRQLFVADPNGVMLELNFRGD